MRECHQSPSRVHTIVISGLTVKTRAPMHCLQSENRRLAFPKIVKGFPAELIHLALSCGCFRLVLKTRATIQLHKYNYSWKSVCHIGTPWSAQKHTATSSVRNTMPLPVHRRTNTDRNACKCNIMQSVISNSECNRNHLSAEFCPNPQVAYSPLRLQLDLGDTTPDRKGTEREGRK